MKNQILLTNIGNRHLTFNGVFFQQLQNKEHDFLTLTKMCYENHEEYIVGLSDILTPVLKEYENKISTVYLIGSDQSEIKGAKVDQDTWWAAQLIKREFDKIGNFETIVLKNNSFATDTDAQINFFLTVIRNLYKVYPDSNCILMDVGGTPQQKLALKQTCEFVWDQEKLKIINQNIQNKETSIVKNEVSRDLLKLEQIIHLLKEGQYRGAQYLALEIKQLEIPHLVAMLKFCNFRFIQLYSECCNGNLSSKTNLGQEFFETFVKNYKTKKNNNEKVRSLLSNQKITNKEAGEISFEITEKYYLAQWHWIMQDYTAFVLAIQQFIETLINGFVTAFTGFDIFKYYYSKSYLLQDYIIQEYPEIYTILLNMWSEKVKPSLPVHIIIAEEFVIQTNPEILPFFEDLRSILESLNGSKKMVGLDTLRNEIAHKGKGVNNKALENILPSNDEDPLSSWADLMKRWENMFQYPEINIYSNQSDWIIDYIRRN